ncbi:hypothetical protein FQN54_005576 [Arachnomyces sp. PD_36]|nr:hypothetical protein FQN54_005576 [Arachnomyces sp. PD_36]
MGYQDQTKKRKTGAEVAQALSAHIKGKTVLTTGVSPKSLGASFVQTIAAHSPKLLILAGRDASKIDQTVSEIKSINPHVSTRSLILDLSSQAQIREAAAEVNGYEENIDVLVNNAGVMACPYSSTVDGLETQFGTNHIGHFLFTNLILDKVLASPNPRIVNVSSDGHWISPIRWDDIGFENGNTYNQWRAYGQAKTANILFSVHLAEKLGDKGLHSFSLHPGAIWTNVGRHITSDEEIKQLFEITPHLKKGGDSFLLISIEEGTSTHVYAAFDPEIEGVNGAYLMDAGIAPEKEIKPYAVDKTEAAKLWKLSEDIVGQKFEI